MDILRLGPFALTNLLGLLNKALIYQTLPPVQAKTSNFAFCTKQMLFCGHLVAEMRIMCAMCQHKKITYLGASSTLRAPGLCPPSLIGSCDPLISSIKHEK